MRIRIDLTRAFVPAYIVFMVLTIPLVVAAEEQQPPKIRTPGSGMPSDANVLFNGSDLSAWMYPDGRPVGWIVSEGAMTVKDGGIVTRQHFGDIQLHLEFATPSPSKGTGQDCGNSGVYFQGNYEIQVLDSYENETYLDGMCGAIYEIAPPLVNATRPPGVWQVYEVIFRAPRFDAEGNVVRKGVITAFLNGVLIQDHVEVHPTRANITEGKERPLGPLYLQDHGHPVRYRNIWVREL